MLGPNRSPGCKEPPLPLFTHSGRCVANTEWLLLAESGPKFGFEKLKPVGELMAEAHRAKDFPARGTIIATQPFYRA